MGSFNSAYDLYNPICALATAGFPIAISRMVSENMTKKRYNDVKRIHDVSVPLFFISGTIGFLLIIGGSFIHPKLINNPGVFFVDLALAPTVLFVCLISIYRGYYQGMKDMTPTAVSEVIDKACHLIVGLGLCYGIMSYGMNEYYQKGTVFSIPYQSESLARSALLPISAAGAILGVTIGSIVSFLYLFIKYKREGSRVTKEQLNGSPVAKSYKDTFMSLLKIALPIGLGAFLMNAASFIDGTLIQDRINHIMSTEPESLMNVYKGLINPEIVQRGTTHTFLYGIFGYSSPVIMLVNSVAEMFGVSALPSVTSAWVTGDRQKIKSSIETVLKMTMLFTIPAGFGLVALSGPLMNLLYSDTPSEAYIASKVLMIMGIAVIFSATTTPVCSMLQAVGRADLPVKLLVIGMVIKITLNYALVGIPQINIQGAGVGTLVDFMFVLIASLYFLCRETYIIPDFKSIFIKPLSAGMVSATSAYFSHKLLCQIFQSKVSTLISIIIAVLIYLISMLMFKAITASDIKMLPKGEKFLKVLEKLKWI